MPNTFINNLIIYFVSIFVYLITFYLVLFIINYSDLSIMLLFKQLMCSFLGNFIYFNILYYFVVKKEF